MLLLSVALLTIKLARIPRAQFLIPSHPLLPRRVNFTATMAEKDYFHVDETYNSVHPQYVEPSGIESKQSRISEAAALYGDIQTAEEYGYVTRGYVEKLKTRSSIADGDLD